MLSAKRKDDRVIGRGGLKFEVERAAEAFTQCQPPGSVDPRTESRMNHQLHPARFIEKPLHHQRVPGWDRAERFKGRSKIRRELSPCPLGNTCLLHQPRSQSLLS